MTDDWMVLCRQLVPNIFATRDWKLVTLDKIPHFIEEACHLITDGVINPQSGAESEATARRAIIHQYCRELYKASGEDGTLRQRRAFEEIGRHAQGVAFRYERSIEVIQTCVQRALQIVWEKRDQVREPGSFLRWIEQIVYYEIKGHWKAKSREREVPMTEAAPVDEGNGNDELLHRFWDKLSAVPAPDTSVMDRQLREQLWPEVRRVLGDNERYQAVIVGYYFYELGLPTLAEMLHTSVSNTYVLKSRALSRLRTDEEFVRRFADALETLPGGKP